MKYVIKNNTIIKIAITTFLTILIIVSPLSITNESLYEECVLIGNGINLKGLLWV